MNGKSELPFWRTQLSLYTQITKAVYRDLVAGLPALRAMSLVYTTLLAMVPLLAVTFSIFKSIGIHNKLRPFVLSALEPLGDKAILITDQLFTFVDNIKVGVIGIVGVALLVFTVFSLVQKIERAFNFTWHTQTHTSIWRRLASYISVVTIGPALVFIAIIITAIISSSSLIITVSTVEPYSSVAYLINKAAPYLLVISAFTLIYKVIPNTNVKLGSALTGAVSAGILWVTTGWLYTLFISNSANYTLVYSGFAVLMLFMIWLYLSWLILLIGASIAYYHQYPERMTSRHQKTNLSPRIREKVAILIMYRLSEYHGSTSKGYWTENRLSRQLDIAYDSIVRLVGALQKENLVIRQQKRPYYLKLARSPEQISVREIWDAARQADESDDLNRDKLENHTEVDKLLSRIDDTVADTIGELALSDLMIDLKKTNPKEQTFS